VCTCSNTDGALFVFLTAAGWNLSSHSRLRAASTDESCNKCRACCGNIVVYTEFTESWFLWPPNRAAIIFCRCGFFFLFFLACSQRSQIGCLPYFHAWCGLSTNIECRPEMWCMQLAENTGRKNLQSAHHCTTLSGYIFVKRHVSTIRKKTY